jgi:AcrR family transcriptional regulator
MTGPAVRPDRPVGRRPGDPETTKAEILDAARHVFGDVGFDRATIRTIAAAADVDPALIIHHFGSKHGLFVAAHALPFDPGELFAHLVDVPPSERGAQIVRIYLSMIETRASAPLSLLRTAATNEAAARMLREFITAAFIARAPELAPGRDGERRLALAGAQVIGVVFGRVVLELEPLASATVDELVDALGPVVQRYLDGPLTSTVGLTPTVRASPTHR